VAYVVLRRRLPIEQFVGSGVLRRDVESDDEGLGELSFLEIVGATAGVALRTE
jgi:hypothetical protein